jgi:hypothetical protein
MRARTVGAENHCARNVPILLARLSDVGGGRMTSIVLLDGEILDARSEPGETVLWMLYRDVRHEKRPPLTCNRAHPKASPPGSTNVTYSSSRPRCTDWR